MKYRANKNKSKYTFIRVLITPIKKNELSKNKLKNKYNFLPNNYKIVCVSLVFETVSWLPI